MDERGGHARGSGVGRRGGGRARSGKARGAQGPQESAEGRKARRARPGCGEAQGREDVREARGARESPGAREEQSRTRGNFVMDAYARFRYTVKADVPEWRNGRRGGLKNRCLTTCEFDSRLGHQFSRFCKAALWVAFFILCQKTGPEGISFVIQMEGARETVLRVRKLQRLLTSAAQEDKAARWHPPDCQP